MGSMAVPIATMVAQQGVGMGANALMGGPEQPGAPPQQMPAPQMQPQQQQMMQQPQNDQFQILMQLLQRLGQGGGF